MKDPVRLLHGGEASELERRLLAACAAEEPPSDGPARLAVALGLGVGAAVSLAPAAAASQGSAAASLAPGAGKLAWPWIAWLAGGAVLGAGALVYTALQRPDADPTPLAAPAQTVAQPETAEAQPPSEGAAAPDVAASADAPSAPSRSIAREIAELDAVRAHLGRGDGRGAIAALDAYARLHPGGVLRQEAQVLRVEALVAGGELTQARRLGERFLRDNPSSPHGARIRDLLDGADGRP